jgi:CRISPR type I-E-associated protein CasB/Cse2
MPEKAINETLKRVTHATISVTENDKKGHGQSNREFIERLSELSSADLAALRRCNRNPLTDERLFSVLGRLGVLGSYNHSLIACLYAAYHRAGDTPRFIEWFTFGRAFRNAYDPDDQKKDTRFKAILTADKGDALAFRLRQAVHLLKSRDEPVDFSALLADLYNWENRDRRVQRKWAEGYYRGYYEMPDDAPVQPEETSDDDFDDLD